MLVVQPPYPCFSLAGLINAPPAIFHKGETSFCTPLQLPDNVTDIASLNDPGTKELALLLDLLLDLLMDLGGVDRGRYRGDWRALGLVRGMLAARGCYLIFI